MTKTKPWSPKDDSVLRELYSTHTTGQIAKKLGRTVKAVETRAHRLGLRKRAGYSDRWQGARLEKLKRLYPTTKNYELAKIFGTSADSIKSAAQYHGLKKCKTHIHDGHYKKGHQPYVTHPVGYIRQQKDGRVLIKVSDDEWMTYQLYVWLVGGGKKPHENQFARLKPKYCGLHYSKWQKKHIELVTHSENLERNTINRFPPELISAIRVLSRLKGEIENE